MKDSNSIDEKTSSKPRDMSRRTFLKNSGLVVGGVIGGSLLSTFAFNQSKKETSEKNESKKATNPYEARTFFSRNEDFDVLTAAVERLFPETEAGPGAIALGVPYFIDRQLTSEWGTNAYDYMSGPFPNIEEVVQYEMKNPDQQKQGAGSDLKTPTPTPRYQTRMNRAAIFLEGVQAIERTARAKHQVAFIQLTGEEQDAILQLFEDGEVTMNGVNAQLFFDLLFTATIEGAYADPVYGGNRQMAGWKMKEYPGPRMSYLQDIETEEFIVMAPESLRQYQGLD